MSEDSIRAPRPSSSSSKPPRHTAEGSSTFRPRRARSYLSGYDQTAYDFEILEADDEDSPSGTASPSSEEPGAENVTWRGFLTLWITLFRLVGRIIYRYIRLAVKVTMRSIEISISKFIIYPLFSLWYDQLYRDHVHFVNAWNKEPWVKQNMRKSSRYLTYTLLTLLSAWIYAYINPRFSSNNTVHTIIDPVSESVATHLSVDNIHKQLDPDPDYVSSSTSYQFYIASMNSIEQRLSSIDSRLEEQNKINAQTTEDLDTCHNEIQTIWQAIQTNQDSISETLQQTADYLTQQMVMTVNEEDDLIVSPKFLSWLRNNRFYKQLAQGNSKTAAKRFFDDFKRLMEPPVDEEKLALDYLEGEIGPNTYDYALEQNGATVFYGKNTSEMPPAKWAFFNFKVSTLIEFAASNVIRANDDCWSFTGPIGTLGIRLSNTAYVKYISIKHLAADIESAPRAFEVDGVLSFSDGGGMASLGEFQFDNTEPRRTQYFRVKDERPVKAIFVKFKSNWGSKERTEICKVSVYSHGHKEILAR